MFALWLGALTLVCLGCSTQGANWAGCLYSKQVCEDGEVCYDDGAFGRCIDTRGPWAPRLYRYNVSPENMQMIHKAFQRLLGIGLTWDETDTQCIADRLLTAFSREPSKFNFPFCLYVSEKEESRSLYRSDVSELDDDDDDSRYHEFLDRGVARKRLEMGKAPFVEKSYLEPENYEDFPALGVREATGRWHSPLERNFQNRDDDVDNDGPADLASIRFSPGERNGVFADEFYYPQGLAPDASQADRYRRTHTPSHMDLLSMVVGASRRREEEEMRQAHERSPDPAGLLMAKRNNPRRDGPRFEGSHLPEPLDHLYLMLRETEDPYLRHAPTSVPNAFLSKHYNTPERFRQGLESKDATQGSQPGNSEEQSPLDATFNRAMLSFLGRQMGRGEAEDGDDPEDEDDHSEQIKELHQFSPHYNTPSSFRHGLESRDEQLMERLVDQLEQEQEQFEQMQEQEENNAGSTEDDEGDEDGSWGPALEGPRGFSQLYNTPDSFRAGLETRDVEDAPEEPQRRQGIPLGHPGYGVESMKRNSPRMNSVFLRQNRRNDPYLRAGQLEQEEQLVQRQSSQQEQEQQRQQQQQQQQEEEEEEEEEEKQQDQQEQDKEQESLEQEDEREREREREREMTARFLQAAMAANGQNKDSVPEEIQAEEEEVERAPGRAYTEGGLVFLPDKQGLDSVSLGELLDWGFKRRERLDVKKPGPLFNTNNYAFHQKRDRVVTFDGPLLKSTLSKYSNGPRAEAYHAPPAAILQHKKTRFADETPLGDPNMITVKLKNEIKSWAEGERVINDLAKAIRLNPVAFGKRRIDPPNQVSFKVKQVYSPLNASEVAKQINDMKDEIKKRISVDVDTVSVGEQQLDGVQVTNAESWRNSDKWVLGAIISGVSVSAVLVSALTCYGVRRLQRSREKLRGLAAPDTEASKDYQDLCRARMAKKAETERTGAGTDPLHVDQRVASLSRESRESEGSNNSPSSRSSTSSWSEEPALTNMDISTGHMVLAYMEDHLKNKDRLEQEWQALCAYEAEPCETTVSQKPENVKKNRYYPHVLPYDHSRVVLNELANATGSDYINASTITDHDPRNPAYLATQGPLPHTAADLWQLVWEQGSVVMVMLSRLTENGTAMCHRYWPEEGSELYHIYEVHLVSEHIWCDDYLVRSFYLKNLKTGETRTVTQFHFLSWPDHGVPLNTKPLLDFRRKVNKSYRGRSCPIVVHCSDGAGRTGTYCLIDMVLNRMAKGAKEIDIAATLEHIRDQRPQMVESREQFEFCLAAVADEVHAILKALPAQPTPPAAAVAPPPPSPTPNPPSTKEQKPQKEKENEKEKEKGKEKEQQKKKT